jgi:Zn-dependent protease
MLSFSVYPEPDPRRFPNSFPSRTEHPTKDAHPERPSGAEGFFSGPSFCSLFSLFAPRVFHKSFLFKRFRTLSKKCRVFGGHLLQFLKYYFNFASNSPLLDRKTPLFSPFPFKCLRTLPSSVSCKSCICHSYENTGGVYQLFPFWNSSLSTHHFPTCFSFHSFTICPSHNPFLFTFIQIAGVWGRIPFYRRFDVPTFRRSSRPSLANYRRSIYPTHSMPDLSPDLLALGFIWYVAFLFSTTCHEAAHALVARLGGDDTASGGGQVTLNPIPHIQREPWGMVVIPLLSFLLTRSMIGWASAPYDPHWERRHPRRSAWMALAGPAANYSLMLLAVLGLHLGWSRNWLHYDPVTHRGDFAANILSAFFFLNLLLGTFNLLPVPPLDGSTGIMLFMSEERAHKYLDWLRGNSYAMLGLLVAMLAFRYIYSPIEDFAIHLFFRSQF